MVRIWISMIREPGDCLQANKTAPATSSGSSMSELLTQVADPFLRPPPAKGKFGLHASWTDHADLDAVRSQFPVKRLRKTDLRELRGTVNRFAPKPIDARHRRNHQDGALLLLKHEI